MGTKKYTLHDKHGLRTFSSTDLDDFAGEVIACSKILAGLMNEDYGDVEDMFDWNSIAEQDIFNDVSNLMHHCVYIPEKDEWTFGADHKPISFETIKWLFENFGPKSSRFTLTVGEVDEPPSPARPDRDFRIEKGFFIIDKSDTRRAFASTPGSTLRDNEFMVTLAPHLLKLDDEELEDALSHSEVKVDESLRVELERLRRDIVVGEDGKHRFTVGKETKISSKAFSFMFMMLGLESDYAYGEMHVITNHYDDPFIETHDVLAICTSNMPEDAGFGSLNALHGEHGTIVVVPKGDTSLIESWLEDSPEWFKPVGAKALACKARYIEFDSTNDIDPSLPSYVW